MARKFIISEKQYNLALQEGITLNADVSATNGDVGRAISDTKQNAKESGVNMDDATIQVNANDVNEGMVVKKSKLQENSLRKLKKDSKMYSVKDFLNKISKKN